MKRTPKPTLAETVAANRRTLHFLDFCAGKEPRKFTELNCDKPKKPRAKKQPSALKVSEHDIQTAILDYLKAHPGVCWVARFNSGVMVQDGRYTAFNGLKGCPDIMGMKVGGAFFGIEVKSQTGKATPAQLEFINNTVKGGGLAGIARSIEDVDALLFSVL